MMPAPHRQLGGTVTTEKRGLPTSPQAPDAQGLLHSRVFPGLRLPVEPLRACDLAKVLAALAEPE
jgi:hypothetical protein